MENQKFLSPPIKVAFIGDSSVGKTSIVSRIAINSAAFVWRRIAKNADGNVYRVAIKWYMHIMSCDTFRMSCVQR